MPGPKIQNRLIPPRYNTVENAPLQWDDDATTRVFVPFFIPDEEHTEPPAVGTSTPRVHRQPTQNPPQSPGLYAHHYRYH
jgi:hypothetical protein